jgi:hypothetical protein
LAILSCAQAAKTPTPVATTIASASTPAPMPPTIAENRDVAPAPTDWFAQFAVQSPRQWVRQVAAIPTRTPTHESRLEGEVLRRLHEHLATRLPLDVSKPVYGFFRPTGAEWLSVALRDDVRLDETLRSSSPQIGPRGMRLLATAPAHQRCAVVPSRDVRYRLVCGEAKDEINFVEVAAFLACGEHEVLANNAASLRVNSKSLAALLSDIANAKVDKRPPAQMPKVFEAFHHLADVLMHEAVDLAKDLTTDLQATWTLDAQTGMQLTISGDFSGQSAIAKGLKDIATAPFTTADFASDPLGEAFAVVTVRPKADAFRSFFKQAIFELESALETDLSWGAPVTSMTRSLRDFAGAHPADEFSALATKDMFVAATSLALDDEKKFFDTLTKFIASPGFTALYRSMYSSDESTFTSKLETQLPPKWAGYRWLRDNPQSSTVEPMIALV